MNIIDDVKTFIESKVDLYTSLSIDYFQGKDEEIIIRHNPTTLSEITYLDGSRNGNFKFSILTKSLNGSTAVAQLNTLIQELYLIAGIDINPLLWVKIEPITGIIPISKTETRQYIYSASFKLEYNRRK